MAWIELHQSLVNHPKTRRLVRRLDIKTPAAVGHLTCLWCWCLDYAQDGDLSMFDNQEIADAAMWDDDADLFAAGMEFAGFIEKTPDGRRVHDWHDYAGRLVDRRAANAKRMKDARATHVQRTCATRAEMCEATVPNPTVPNHVHDDSPPDGDGTEIPFEDGPLPGPPTPDESASLEDVTPKGVTPPVPPAPPAPRREITPAPKPSGKGYTADFEAVWTAHPGGGSKLPAFVAFQKPGVPAIDVLLAAIEAQKQDRAWFERHPIPGDFYPHWKNVATWLNARAWDDKLKCTKVVSINQQTQKPWAHKPWFTPWVTQYNAKFMAEQDTVGDRMDQIQRHGFTVDREAARAVYRSQGFEAVMDHLWASVQASKVTG